ncbi:TolC family protein [Odoribacter sp. OttesenSCG-928-L07]|nr:TolC family protein [Odoribacter sp. OttesenSCG-928-L07]MDL2240050.1 TolC family protein [Bacteroidales bacterium OttesenSCG-928-K22]
MNKYFAMRKIIILLFLIIPCFALSQENQYNPQITRLTLEDVIQIAQQQSPSAMSARHRFKNSYWQYRYFKANYMPQVSLYGNPLQFENQNRMIETPTGSEFVRYNQIYSDLSLGIDQAVGFTGGNLSVFTNLGYTMNFKEDTMYFSSAPINVRYTQPIFGYNSYKWERKIEPIKFKEAQQSYIESMEDVAITAANYFFSCLLAQMNKSIQEINLANNDTLHQIAQGRYMMGTIAENEVLNMELNYLNSKSQLETAKLDLEMNLFDLKSFLRIKEDAEIELIPPAIIPELEIDADEAVIQANENRSDVLSYERQLIEAEQALTKAKREGRFSMDLSLTYGLDKTAPTFPQAYREPSQRQVAMLGINVPILDWGRAKGQIKMAESQQELIRTTVEQNIIDFNQEIYIKAKQFNMQYSQLMIAAKSDTVAQKRYEFTKQRYLIGTIDITELNSSLADKDSNQRGYIAALQQFWVNYFQIRRLTLYDFVRKEKIKTEIDVLMQ